MATVKGASIHVEGLSEFRRELRRLDDRTLTSELKDANFAVAQRVVGWAHYRAAGQGRMAVKAAATLRASKSQARAAVSFGGAKAPFAAGSEFGAIRNIPRRAYATSSRNGAATAATPVTGCSRRSVRTKRRSSKSTATRSKRSPLRRSPTKEHSG
jgi:hypothetical protein